LRFSEGQTLCAPGVVELRPPKENKNMDELKMPVVSEDDVLVGEKTFEVSSRTGGQKKVTVKAMPWRTALLVAESSAPGAGSIEVLKTCLSREQSRDEFLNEILPAHLYWIVGVAGQLSAGIDETKKRMAASRVKTNHAAGNAAAPPGSAITSPPSAS